ncbi:hypothetical protein PMAYCL1PPCAC_10977, partial [Pristionchus mayeri]
DRKLSAIGRLADADVTKYRSKPELCQQRKKIVSSENDENEADREQAVQYSARTSTRMSSVEEKGERMEPRKALRVTKKELWNITIRSENEEEELPARKAVVTSKHLVKEKESVHKGDQNDRRKVEEVILSSDESEKEEQTREFTCSQCTYHSASESSVTLHRNAQHRTSTER